MKHFNSLVIRIALLGPLAMLALGCNKSADKGPTANAEAAKKISDALMAGNTGGEQAAAVVGTGWATITGQFLYDGDPPQMPPYDVNKEMDICAPGGKKPPQETLIVSPGKGIKNVVVFLTKASRVNDSAKPKTEPVLFDQKGCIFLSHVSAAAVGQTLDIKNSDPTGHNTNIPDLGLNQLVPNGGSIPFKVPSEKAAPSKVTCSIHPWMTAYLLTRKNGYYAITDADGKFEIANVPAGEPLEFQVWHESGAAAGNGLVGVASDADIKWSNRGRVSMNLKENEKRNLEVKVPPKAFK